MTHELKRSPKIEDLGEVTRGRDEDFILIVGCMCSGKSRELIERFYGNEDVEAFKPAVDTRDKDVIKSREFPNMTIPCTMISNPMDMVKSKEKIILIEEFQFFQVDLLKDAVKELRVQHKIIVMAGLNLDANRREWDSYTAMSEMCDREVQLKATCDVCGKHTAKYTKKISGSVDKTVEIEGSDVKYSSRCSSCWEK